MQPAGGASAAQAGPQLPTGKWQRSWAIPKLTLPGPPHSPVHHDGALHVLEQLLGLKQQRDIQNHIAVPWREAGTWRSTVPAHTCVTAPLV